MTKMTVLENLQLGAFSRKDKDEIQNDIEKMFNTFPILRERQPTSRKLIRRGAASFGRCPILNA